MNKLKIKFSAQTNHKKNGAREDAFRYDESAGIVVLADGLGGPKWGGLASRLAAEWIPQFIHSTSPETEKTWPFEKKETLTLEENFLRMALLKTNAKIIEQAEKQNRLGWMGCSALSLLFLKDACIIASIGNCRGYLWRRGVLTQLTEDNSLARYKKWHPLRATQNIPLNFLGKAPNLDTDASGLKHPKKGDIFLLATPGLINTLTPDEILEEISKNNNDINKLSKSLVERAVLKNPSENVAALILSI